MEERNLKVDGGLYCFLNSADELNRILEIEEPEWDCELREKYREDIGKFNGSGIYNIAYKVFNPCEHGFWIEKKETDYIEKVTMSLQNILAKARKECNVSNESVRKEMEGD